MNELTPSEIVRQLDRHIVGQDAAKRSVAIAMRNRWRRMQLDERYRSEVTPKNILMIGPTGVGKTEIARRIAKLTDAPFLKVEATKFTEVGYVGKEVDSIIKDLASAAMKMLREKQYREHRPAAAEKAERLVLQALMRKLSEDADAGGPPQPYSEAYVLAGMKAGIYDDTVIKIKFPRVSESSSLQIMTPPGMEEMAFQLEELFEQLKTGSSRPVNARVKDALKAITEDEVAKLVNENDIKRSMVSLVENHGIVFIDEIDKICENKNDPQTRVSREGVQRDLLPLIEGCAVRTQYGTIRTDHILFITSGAFQVSKPSDLIPELQGRLPIRVELQPLTAGDFARILTEPHASLTEQCAKLMATEGVTVSFTRDGIEAIAEAAYYVNSATENIGARRLHTIMEKLTEDISFHAPEYSGRTFVIDKRYVSEHLGALVENVDLSRYIL